MSYFPKKLVFTPFIEPLSVSSIVGRNVGLLVIPSSLEIVGPGGRVTVAGVGVEGVGCSKFS